MPIREKLVSEISAADIFDLINQQTPEDSFLEFKAEILDPRKPHERRNADEADWVADVVAFANAQGGHILIGLEADDQERAARLKPIAGDEAKRLADKLRDLAIAHIKPGIAQLEVAAFEITTPEWIVVARVPHSPDKPHMSSHNRGTRFTLRDGNRKRELAYDEIRELFLAGPQQQLIVRFLSEIESINSRLADLEKTLRKADEMVEYDIAEMLEERDLSLFSRMMQETFEERVGTNRFFRITGTPADLGQVSADVEQPALLKLLETPPNPHGRSGGWDVRPLPPLKRTALGFENQRVEFHHMKFVKNGHLEFWTAIDQYFCWQQDPAEMNIHPRLYPYSVVEHPLSFVRLYRALADLLQIRGDILFQMQYLNIKGAILLPYQPESIGFQHPFEPVRPLEGNRLVFERRRFAEGFDPDPSALEIIKELYYAFGYGREHIPFFDATGHSNL